MINTAEKAKEELAKLKKITPEQREGIYFHIFSCSQYLK